MRAQKQTVVFHQGVDEERNATQIILLVGKVPSVSSTRTRPQRPQSSFPTTRARPPQLRQTVVRSPRRSLASPVPEPANRPSTIHCRLLHRTPAATAPSFPRKTPSRLPLPSRRPDSAIPSACPAPESHAPAPTPSFLSAG